MKPNEPISRPHLPPPVLKNSYTEEFAQNTNVMEIKGWVFKNHSSERSIEGWHRGYSSRGKDGIIGPEIGPAYSSKGDAEEFAYAGHTDISIYLNMWMLTPPIEMKNGDKISFFTKMDQQSKDSTNMLEIRLNPIDTTSDVGNYNHDIGKFTMLMGKVFEGYPKEWTKKEFIISGLNGTIRSRIAFRYYNPGIATFGAIGIDVLKFEKM